MGWGICDVLPFDLPRWVGRYHCPCMVLGGLLEFLPSWEEGGTTLNLEEQGEDAYTHADARNFWKKGRREMR